MLVGMTLNAALAVGIMLVIAIVVVAKEIK